MLFTVFRLPFELHYGEGVVHVSACYCPSGWLIPPKNHKLNRRSWRNYRLFIQISSTNFGIMLGQNNYLAVSCESSLGGNLHARLVQPIFINQNLLYFASKCCMLTRLFDRSYCMRSDNW